MAVLTNLELAEIRRGVAGDTDTQDWDKTIINAALQAIEDWYENNKAAGATAIDTATSPYTFTTAVKKKLFRFWLGQKFNREAD
jgi:hypothetical protein